MKTKGSIILVTLGLVSLITTFILIKLNSIPLKDIFPILGVSLSALIMGLTLTLSKNIQGPISTISYVFALIGTSIFLLNSFGLLSNFASIWNYAFGAIIISLLLGLYNSIKAQGFKTAPLVLIGFILPIGIITKMENSIFYGIGFLILGLVSVITLIGSLKRNE